MSLTSALNTAVASLKVNQTAIQLLSANVAHANDPNYSKKTIATESLYNGPDQPGGIVVAGYSSAVNDAMRKQYEALTAQSSTTSAASDYLSRVQDILGSSTASLSDVHFSSSDSTCALCSFFGAGLSSASEPVVINCT